MATVPASINAAMRNRFIFGTPMCPAHTEMGIEADRTKEDYANVFAPGRREPVRSTPTRGHRTASHPGHTYRRARAENGEGIPIPLRPVLEIGSVPAARGTVAGIRAR
jgi:hypothetical protein